MDSLGDRMKDYENAYRLKLPKRMPVIIRIDGKSFHTYTRGMGKPFDVRLNNLMRDTCIYLCQNISGCKLAYTQSDEINLLITNYDRLSTEPWFDNNLQKLTSVTASMATAKFNEVMKEKYIPDKELALFDSRAWILPEEEVCNYFIWRQQDATKNSISTLAQHHFSHKELQGLKGSQMQDKLMTEKEINWNNLLAWEKRGTVIYKKAFTTHIVTANGLETGYRSKWVADTDTPIFTKDRGFINQYVYLREKASQRGVSNEV